MCRFCVGNLFTNQSLHAGWSAGGGAAFADGLSRRAFMAMAGATAGAAGLGLRADPAAAAGEAPADLIFKGGTSQPAVMKLGREMKRTLQGVNLRRGAPFDAAARLRRALLKLRSGRPEAGEWAKFRAFVP